ncbi:MAG TPA: tetratricopeptide repeat protein, partial [Blastocatellia bacterium]|nr:tetratricopeptide repeat protein [Blastocatellia bacterium]
MSLNKSKTLRAAEKYVLQGKIPAAIDEYRKVVDADPGDMTTINTLGDLYVRAGRIPDAIQNFSRIADSYRDSGFTLKAIAMLKKISKLDPTNIETSMKLANLYSQQGLFVEARQQYLQVADAYARAGQTRKALEAYQKIADLDPSNTSVRIKLGEIYSREGMIEQAHEAFIMAGAEFLRKGETELALAANLKALAIRPEGRQALTAIVSIYTQQGQADRAINILCDAFEKNPGDVELLTILGRTYLAAGYMDDAERTFLSLVELDKSRYNYLLEVGRKFLQTGDLDRAAEQIDGCLDVLISKREEDKGIDFLRRILERDVNHVGALKRLAQIFVRIREDHNLIATLNSLAEANLQKGDERAAVEVLEELVRLEPDEPRHRQRLYNLGVQDITEPGAPDVIRATGPLDYESAAFDDTFVIRQISEAEILAGHGQIDHAVSMLKEILSHAPENVQVHLKLKDIYLRAGMMEKAASQCMALSQVYESRGEPTKAMDCITEAQHLNPALQPGGQYAQWQDDGQEDSVGFEIPLDQTASQGGSSFEVSTSDRLDLSRYQTGALSDQMGFVTAPPKDPGRRGTPADANPPMAAPRPPSKPFTYSDTFTDGPAANVEGPAPSQDAFFTSAGSLPSDTMPSLLRDELEGIDFYIAQGYTDIAHDTLNRLRDEHGDHPEIMCRYERLGIAAPPTRAIEEDALARIGFEAAFGDGQDSVSSDDDFAVDSGPNGKFHHLDELPPIMESPEQFGRATGELVNAESNGHAASGIPDQELVFGLGDSHTPAGQQEESPFMVYQESGPLNDDLMVRFNTSELSMPSPEPDESAIQAEPMAPAEPSMYAETFDPMAAIPMGEPEIELPTDDSFFTNEPAPRGPVSDAGKSIPMRDPASRAKSNDVSAAPPTGDLAARIKISEGVFPTGDLARQK